MTKARLFFAAFALVLLAGCADVAPTAPQDTPAAFRGFLGSGN
jgi:hypothetical protein